MISHCFNFPLLLRGSALHQLFAALVTILLSFCHHSVASRSLVATNTYGNYRPSPALTFPDRQDLARTASAPGYAESTCLSCRTMSVSFITR